MFTFRGLKYTIKIISTPKLSKYAMNMIAIHKVPEKVIDIEPFLKGQKYAIYMAPQQCQNIPVIMC